MSLQTLERRIAALEARLADVEGGYGETIYQLHRKTIRIDLNVTKILDHLKITAATEDDVDNILDEN